MHMSLQGGLKLSIALLDGGNADVQKSFLALLQDSDADDLRAADGSEGSFFARVKGRLRLVSPNLRPTCAAGTGAAAPLCLWERAACATTRAFNALAMLRRTY